MSKPKATERKCKDCIEIIPVIPRRVRCCSCYKKYTNYTKINDEVKFIDDDDVIDTPH